MAADSTQLMMDICAAAPVATSSWVAATKADRRSTYTAVNPSTEHAAHRRTHAHGAGTDSTIAPVLVLYGLWILPKEQGRWFFWNEFAPDRNNAHGWVNAPEGAIPSGVQPWRVSDVKRRLIQTDVTQPPIQ